MCSLKLKLYHCLPSGIRSIAASIHGYRLGRLRYGPATGRLVQQAIERETWKAEQWKAWQQEKLGPILHRAATRVPFYRQQWSERLPRREKAAYDSIGSWPILKKQSLRTSPAKFLAEDCNPRTMWCEHTSGSTGTPITLWQSRQTVQSWYAIFEARWRLWHGLSRHDRWAIIGGQLIVPVKQDVPPFWVWNSALHQLYLSAHHLSESTAKAYLDALTHYEVKFIWGYASALFTLASFAITRGLAVPPLKAVISNAEPFYAHQREIISKAFACPTYDTYGLSEMVCAASECEQGTMHLWPETGVWEVLRDSADEPVKPGEIGRLICTGLLNADMPLIRYETGDRVAMAKPGACCACGRTLPILMSIDGRTDDVIVTPDGRRLGRLDPVFKADFPISEAQIIQDAPDHLRVRVVPAKGFDTAVEASIASALQERVGTMRISFERVSSIPRGPTGKFKMVVSCLPQSSGQRNDGN